MVKLLAMLGLGFVFATDTGADVSLGNPLPSWKVGDTWAVCDWAPQMTTPQRPREVGITYMHTKRYFRFEVLKEVELQGKRCFKLLYAAYDPKTGEDYRENQCLEVYYSLDKGMLEFMADRSVRPVDGTVHAEKPSRIIWDDSGQIGEYVKAHVYNEFAMGYLTDVPLMFPVWDQQKREWQRMAASRLRVVSQDAPRKVQLGNIWLTQELTERSDNNGKFLEYRLKGNFQDKEDEGTDKILVQGEFIMEFRPGEPWWRECRRYEYGQFVRYWALVRIGATDLPVEEPVIEETAK